MNQSSLTTGNITKSLLRFAFPMMVGNLLQQLYNIVDTLIVGQFLGKEALAAVGSSYSLMTFLTSILLGLCMGSGVCFSICFGKREYDRMKSGIFMSFVMIGGAALLLSAAVFAGMDLILKALQVPGDVYGLMRDYLWVIFWGIAATFLYNFFASLLRAVGNSVVPLLFLGIAALSNIGLDLLFIICFHRGVRGAAEATVLSQYGAGVGIMVYTMIQFPQLRLKRENLKWQPEILKEIFQLSFLTCIQQSVMNFGILMIQGLVNSFGAVVMAAFSVAVKIDTFAYMPVQDFGNAFSTFVAQNYGAGKTERIREGIRSAVKTAFFFGASVSALVFVFARQLMLIFVNPRETEIIREGVEYLRIEGSFYYLIGFLFLCYGYYRAVKRPGMSLVLTVISLGTRVALAYILSAVPWIGVTGIWASVPIGWLLADLAGYLYYRRARIE
ncbi:MAG: MATE family efflux transporter [Ruminococcus sp.]|jgi:putative MATE family efflux protein|uniref:Probable multidrug resistance protein NorM n=1 Tax=Schaedlerella arabinosiphila TaxID=2044587 RepID=A0A426DF32_9FIRM|nr:MATE family efflux transporter [Schaedlerella arabinosiphila]MCI8722158.1 MATE family efflux transporter [Ruminococcus sp.]MCI9211414.1 MATE family efflux transporter [Ruminococcus sp.]RRK31322.1 MATE family efflux transporter [Schaedlerella arabinosiphila]